MQLPEYEGWQDILNQRYLPEVLGSLCAEQILVLAGLALVPVLPGQSSQQKMPTVAFLNTWTYFSVLSL